MEPFLKSASWPTVSPSRFSSRIACVKSGSAEELGHQLANVDASELTQAITMPVCWRGIAILGLADDEGVRLNGGRTGANEGPAAFRAAMARYGSADSIALNSPVPVVDVGDICPGDSMLETHERVQAISQRIVEAGFLPVGIGGGHDLTLPFVAGVGSKHTDSLDGIYFDAHLDVREELGSGMPFRRLLETGVAKSLRCLGYDPYSNSESHTEWFFANGGNLDWFEPRDWPQDGLQFVSVDLDVIDASQAPGVSAPNPNGVSAAMISEFVISAGRAPNVQCIDFMELSPINDHDGRTARLAAHLFLCFYQGFSERLKSMQVPPSVGRD